MQYLLLLVVMLTATWGNAQVVQVLGSETFKTCITQQREVGLDSALNRCIADLRQQGYLESNLDSVATLNDTLNYYTHLGPLYEVGVWESGANPNADYGPVRLDTLEAPKNLGDLPRDANTYLDQRGRDGYPFASVQYKLKPSDSLALNGKTITWSGPRITYGGVRYVTDLVAPVSARYLERYLNIEPGRQYKSTEIDQLNRRLKTITFLNIKRPPVVVFEGGQAFVYVDAEPRKTSRFDFLLGFLPNSTANDGQLLLTGDVTLELENSLSKGERLFFNFERLQPEATEVVIETSYPYVLGSPYGARGSFNLYRQQDDWLRINYEAGGSYTLGGLDAIELYYEGGQAQVLGFDTAQVLALQTLPEVLDASRNGFGVRLKLDRRDDVFETRAGWRLQTDAAASLRKVTVPGGIRDFGDVFKTLADSVSGSTAQYRSSLAIDQYIRSGRRGVLAVLLRGATIFGAQLPLRNELYRIGGNRLLRGFDEQTIDAQHYGVLTAEYRLLIGGGSYLFAFADQGLLVDPYRAGRDVDQPTGFGAGLRLGTGGGALSLTYAYGRRIDAPIDWQRAKIHIGFASRF